MKRKTLGYTLVETLLATGFVALASVGIYNIFNKAQSISVANDEAVMISQFKNDIVKMYESSDSYSGIDNIALNTARITPMSMRDNTIANIVNKFGGQVLVSPINFGPTIAAGFKIEYPKVQVSSCPNMAIALADRFDMITINGAQVKAYGDQGISPAAVATACDNGAASATMDFEHISTFVVGVAAAVPPMAPAPGTRFSMSPNDVVCDLDSPAFLTSHPAVPANVKNMLIFTFKSTDNYAGRCPNNGVYDAWLGLIESNKAANPALSYVQVYQTIVEPALVNQITYSESKAAQIADASTVCTTASTAYFGANVASSYVVGSGNKCRAN